MKELLSTQEIPQKLSKNILECEDHTDSLIPRGKYNPWRIRRPLVKKGEIQFQCALSYQKEKFLSLFEQAAFFMRELTGCEGIEFVVFSSAC